MLNACTRYFLRFDSGIPDRYQELLRVTLAFVIVLKLGLFAAFGLYSKLWRFVDQADFESIIKAVVTASVGDCPSANCTGASMDKVLSIRR